MLVSKLHQLNDSFRCVDICLNQVVNNNLLICIYLFKNILLNKNTFYQVKKLLKQYKSAYMSLSQFLDLEFLMVSRQKVRNTFIVNLNVGAAQEKSSLWILLYDSKYPVDGQLDNACNQRQENKKQNITMVFSRTVIFYPYLN